MKPGPAELAAAFPNRSPGRPAPLLGEQLFGGEPQRLPGDAVVAVIKVIDPLQDLPRLIVGQVGA